jgi:hypothetical protein
LNFYSRLKIGLRVGRRVVVVVAPTLLKQIQIPFQIENFKRKQL